MEQTIEKNKIIDVDVVIEKYNKANPEKRQLNRKELAKILGCNTQIFSDWKNGKTPKLVYRILKLMELGKCKFEDILIEEEE